MNAKDAYELWTRGLEHLAARRNHQAALVLQRACELEPEKGSVREALARALYNIGETQRAGEEFEAAMQLNPADHYPYFGLALCRARLGDRSRAAGLLKIAIAMKPDSQDYRRALDRLAS
ncbi:MAG TPA: tetratricopeptide repeat protein [Actinomycetota bacterium]|nr:tetratricopeptide repeat protein [Actinomycetota bacterium]